MKWSVAGVIAVLLVQAGFIAYTSLERQSDQIVAANGIPADYDHSGDMIAENELDALFAGPTVYDDMVDESDKIVRISDRRTSARSVEPRLPASKKATNFVNTTTATFNRVVIVVPKYVAPRPVPIVASEPEAKPRDYQAYTKRYPGPVKRSFASKTVSVLKKPYDWVKLLGSKLM